MVLDACSRACAGQSPLKPTQYGYTRIAMIVEVPLPTGLPVSRLLREDLGQSLQLRLVSGRSRRVGGNQRHGGDAIVGGKPDDIGYALLAVLRERRIVGRVRQLMVAVDSLRRL